MAQLEDEKRSAKSLLGKTIVSKAGKKFGEVGNLIFDVKSGELLQLVLRNPTILTDGLELERDEKNNLLIPCSSIVAIGDYVVVAEEDII